MNAEIAASTAEVRKAETEFRMRLVQAVKEVPLHKLPKFLETPRVMSIIGKGFEVFRRPHLAALWLALLRCGGGNDAAPQGTHQ